MCSHYAAALLSQPSISVPPRSCRSSIVLRASTGQPLTSQTKEQDVPAHVIQRIQQLEAEVQKAYQSGYNAGYATGVKVTVNVDLSRASSSRSSKSKLTSNGNSGQTSSSNTSTSSSNGSTGSGGESADTSSNGTGSSKVSTQPNEQQQQQQEQQLASKSPGLIEAPAASASAVDVGDSILRSAVKGLVWRLFSTTVTVSIALLLLHDVLQVEDALKLGALEFTAKFLMYFLHERMWAMLPIP